jgi:hypothetical protein
MTTTGTRILAINDVNNDKLDDLITSNADGTVITVFYYNAETQSYSTVSQINMPADTYVRVAYVNRTANQLQGLMFYVLDDSTPSDPKTKLLLYTQSILDGQYSWTPDITSNVNGLLMNDIQPMILDINGD